MSQLLQIRNFTLGFPGRPPLLDNISLTVDDGEAVALVGESGSGKSLTTRAALGLLPGGSQSSGVVSVKGLDTLTASKQRLMELRRGHASMIFQDPRAGINPVRTVGDFLTETLLRCDGLSRAEANERAVKQLEQVGLRRAGGLMDQHPHQLSGGMLQRVMIAAALLNSPELLLCDEPTTALDVTTQAGIVKLLREEQQSRGMGMLFITHDLNLAASLCERVYVLRRGEVVEHGPTRTVFLTPEQDYTRQLVEATPVIETGAGSSVAAVPGLDPAPLLKVSGLSKTYQLPRGGTVTALDGAEFSLPEGGSLGIVGESGSGKSTLARLVVALETPSSGELTLRDIPRPHRPLKASERKALAKDVQIVFQDPYLSLDPRIPVGNAVADVFRLHQKQGRKEARDSARNLLGRVGIGPERFDALPRALSGGQRQRVALAKALAARPRLLVLDEATSALDVSVQAQVLELVEELRDQLGLTILFVTHDLAVVSRLCSEVLVMHQGRVVEQGPTARILEDPGDDYTRNLIASRPRPLWDAEPVTA
ncbi:ABC transporter ATP-binding protein [Paenarthrobacter aurescens]|uniref:ABC transporter ATP-binding protein n=1 Tax=Paenarthrobacter aurescens TaxID=43663 RepID=A0A4Y3NFX7_PAEAU|nr:ABC transporter ATP-binding protein [Paenarthrobacter aurescens]MDO6142415.1 ABC transporter ATP-binding protein [Paenarthrobacter aurescens]MDO6146262.1 ABC transporter ATP-binding protein [Paenarthrobacter aurescens]MDO6157507.1 ABC transporter ATP-binding protein [Paenarthrobacter aurescens]MDO6161492.1 ABC transporter ATP-binding protein [Paenarthrobacter aurescens]GEB20602.1 ABC transporter ATP-binding protein [Paenarthrobacter aurescens]